MKRSIRLLLALCAAALALPAAASADNRIENKGGEASIISEDCCVGNAFEVDLRGAEIRFYEPNDPKGMNTFPPDCRPGQTKNGVIIEIFCPRSSITKSITIAAGGAEDGVIYNVPGLPSAIEGDTAVDRIASTGDSADVIDGQQGNDVLDAGPNNDELDGGDGDDDLKGADGNDKLDGGVGSDALDGGAGDDTFAAADGYPDKIACGEGTDTVVADQLDQLTDCEKAETRQVAAATDVSSGPDTTRPKLVAAALTSQRVNKHRRAIKMVATSSEKGLVQVTAFVEAGGLNTAMKPKRANVTVGGGGVQVKLKFTKRQLRAIAKDFKRKRRPRVKITVSSVDAAGNTSLTRHVTVWLRR